VQDFLLKTAVLERLNAGVCDAVWQAGGREQPDSDAMIRYLEQANLFLVALDDERCWYRYHHLFADLLRARLRQLDPAVVKTLHRAAAAWYAQQAQAEGDRELASLAIQHALTSEDTRLATLIIEQNWGRWAEAGEIGRLLHWMQAIPRQEILNSPLLASSYAWTLFLRGQIADTLPAVLAAGQALEEALASGRFKPADLLTSIAQGMNLGLRSSLARLGGNLPEAVCLAEQALAVIPPGPNILRGIIYTSLAPALRDLGQYPQAVRVYRDSLSDLQSGSNLTAAASITYYLVQLYLLLGDVNQAEEICLASRRWLEQKRGERAPAAALIHIAWAEILYIHNHLEQALAAAHEGYNLGQKAGSLDAIKQGAIILSRLCQARSDTAQGLRCLDEAEMVNVQAKGSLTLADLQVARARLWVISGRWPEARQWAGQLEGRAVPPPAYIQLLEQAVQVRLLLALNQPEQALVQAQKLLTQTVAVEAHLLFVLALQAQGRSDEALKALSQVVETAAAHQAIRYFMDDGAALLPLLEVLENTATRRDLSVPARAFLQEVLLAVGAGRNKPALHPELVEMPSERELEVLRLMAEGLTNQEIAVRLVLAPNTIKAHTANIYRKLEAENRTQAVTRARELGLIH
jgi:LuxR family maltose regulon positive regulatory protein